MTGPTPSPRLSRRGLAAAMLAAVIPAAAIVATRGPRSRVPSRQPSIASPRHPSRNATPSAAATPLQRGRRPYRSSATPRVNPPKPRKALPVRGSPTPSQ
jgi:hypothetical protein